MWYLEEVFDSISIVTVALTTDPLYFFDLACFARGLDVFEVDVSILAEVDDRTKEVEQPYKQDWPSSLNQ